jgi:LmbE family N-acetylglucosaminyl deacetylase
VKWNVDRVLVLSAHTDDMELGAGATVQMLIDSDVSVKSIVFSDCKKSVDATQFPVDILRKECEAAASYMGIEDLTILEFPVRDFSEHRQKILDFVYKEKMDGSFDLVFAPWTGDLHQDHRVVAEEALRAFMKTQATVLAYEIPGTCPGFSPQILVPISEQQVERKIATLHKYDSQVVRRSYFKVDAVKGQMAYYGTLINSPYAEGFALHRSSVSAFTTK